MHEFLDRLSGTIFNYGRYMMKFCKDCYLKTYVLCSLSQGSRYHYRSIEAWSVVWVMVESRSTSWQPFWRCLFLPSTFIIYRGWVGRRGNKFIEILAAQNFKKGLGVWNIWVCSLASQQRLWHVAVRQEHLWGHIIPWVESLVKETACMLSMVCGTGILQPVAW
jgi:hypothetical protein